MTEPPESNRRLATFDPLGSGSSSKISIVRWHRKNYGSGWQQALKPWKNVHSSTDQRIKRYRDLHFQGSNRENAGPGTLSHNFTVTDDSLSKATPTCTRKISNLNPKTKNIKTYETKPASFANFDTAQSMENFAGVSIFRTDARKAQSKETQDQFSVFEDGVVVKLILHLLSLSPYLHLPTDEILARFLLRGSARF